MLVKTDQLTGRVLDWAVGTASGGVWQPPSARNDFWIWPTDPPRYSKEAPSYTTNWDVSMPIVSNIPGLSYKHWISSTPDGKHEAHINNYDGNWVAFGPDMLTAILRCYVMMKLGDTVDIPQYIIDTYSSSNN